MLWGMNFSIQPLIFPNQAILTFQLKFKKSTPRVTKGDSPFSWLLWKGHLGALMGSIW